MIVLGHLKIIDFLVMIIGRYTGKEITIKENNRAILTLINLSLKL